MPKSRSSVVALVINIALVTLLFAAVLVSAILGLAGNWQKHDSGLSLALKILWGVWLVLFVANLLTHATIAGWKFGRPRPSEWPAALRKAFAEGVRPPSWFKGRAASFTITVVLVSLLGAAVLASVCLWIIGDWDTEAGPLGLTLKIIWGSWWVLVIITVLVRITIFDRQRRLAAQARAARNGNGSPSADGIPQSSPEPSQPIERSES